MRGLRPPRPCARRVLCAAFTGLLLAPDGAAQEVRGSAAQALFEQARELLQRGQLAEACPKFAESLRLEAALGTLLNLALCHEKQGKTASAYLEYTDALARAAHDQDRERQSLAREGISALEPRLIRLTLAMTSQPPAGFWVTLDGVRLEASALGVALPVDPGGHVLRFGAPGRVTKQEHLVADERDRRPRALLEDLARAPAAPAAPAVQLRQPLDQGGSNTRWLVAGACLGAGVAALAFGAYSGLEAGAQWRERNEHCPGGVCDARARLFGDNAKRSAMLSNIVIGGGLAFAGVGVYLFATARDERGRPTGKVTARITDEAVLVGGEF